MVAIWLAIVCVWEFFVSSKLFASKAFFASPSQIIVEFTRVDFWKLLSLDVANSVSLIVISLCTGYVISNGILLITAYSTILYRLLKQLDVVWRYFPIPALIPFGIVFFGLSIGSNIFILTFCTIVLYTSHCITVIEQEEKSYKLSQIAWGIRPFQRFRFFILPLTNALNYRVWSSLVVWVFGVEIIVEMLLGGVFGLGIRLLQYQQLYQTSRLFAYLLVIISISFLLEFGLTRHFQNLQRNLYKQFTGAIIGLLIIVSFGFQIFSSVKSDSSRAIITYKATLNLPLMVYAQKFNSLKAKLQFVASGTQVMDALQAGKAEIGGYADMPNVLTGIDKNPDLKVQSQVVETKDQPTLFLISRKQVSIDSYADLSGSKIAYAPNNPLIKNGLDFTLFSNGTNTGGIQYSSSNDPNSLVQAFNAGKYDSFLGPEPFVSDIEKNTGIKRVNTDVSLIRGVNFTALPLAGLVLNSKLLSDTDKTQFSRDISSSLDFIRSHTDTSHKATGELQSILRQYEMSEDVLLSQYQISTEVDTENTKKLIQLINLFDSQSKLSPDKVAEVYIP